MKKLFLAISMLGFLLVSCEKQEQKVTFDENTLPERLKFQSYDFSECTDRGSVTILRVDYDEWGRKKLDCDGWGLCNATWTWFPKEEKSAEVLTSACSSIVEFDEQINQYYVDILLSEPVPVDIRIELYPLVIDESFTLNTSTVIEKNLTFTAGEYPFDGSLGSYGGFRIYLD